MKTSWMMAALLITSHALSAAQEIRNPQAAPENSNLSKTDATEPVKEPVVVPFSAGTVFNAILTSPLDARRSRAGDPVTAETSEAVAYEGSIVLPKGTIIMGHLVRATIRGRGRHESGLFIQFEKAVLRTGEVCVLNAGIQALAPAQNQALPADATPSDEQLNSALPSPSDVSSEGGDVGGEGLLTVSSSTLDAGRAKAKLDLPPTVTEGGLTKRGLFDHESKGAFGFPNLKVYTPLSEGSDGTVLLSPAKNVHLQEGTRLLIVIQPPLTDY